jgi:hypothetical protein
MTKLLFIKKTHPGEDAISPEEWKRFKEITKQTLDTDDLEDFAGEIHDQSLPQQRTTPNNRQRR